MNPTQKSGNSKAKRRHVKPRKGDFHVKKIARQEAQKVVNKEVETKTALIYSSASNVDYNFSTSLFNLTIGMAPGTGPVNNYLGQTIDPTHLRIKWAAEPGDTRNLFRVILLQDVGGGGAPTSGTLLQLGGTINAPLSPYYNGYQNTYRILHDEFYAMTLLGENTYLTGDIKITSDKMKKISFNSPGIASYGNMWLVFVSDSSVVTPCIVQFSAYLYYKDA